MTASGGERPQATLPDALRESSAARRRVRTQQSWRDSLMLNECKITKEPCACKLQPPLTAYAKTGNAARMHKQKPTMSLAMSEVKPSAIGL